MAKVFANPECNMYGEKKEDWKCQLAPSKSVAANDCRAAKLKINFYFLCVCVSEKSTVVPVREAACAHIYHIFIHGIESSFPICHLIQARIVCRVRVRVGGTYDFDIYVIPFELSFVFFFQAQKEAPAKHEAIVSIARIIAFMLDCEYKQRNSISKTTP